MSTSRVQTDTVRKAQGGSQHSAHAQIDSWAEKHGNSIQIHLSGPTRTWVSNDPDSVRYHRTLFRDLREALLSQGCWQFGEEGLEEIRPLRGSHLIPVRMMGEKSMSDLIIAERGD